MGCYLLRTLFVPFLLREGSFFSVIWFFLPSRSFLTSRRPSFRSATITAFFFILGLNFPLSHRCAAPTVTPVRMASSFWVMPKCLRRLRIKRGEKRDSFTSSGGASTPIFPFSHSFC